MVGLPQAVFLHNRFSRSFLLSSLPTPLPLILQDPEVAATKCKKEGNAHLATGAPPTPCYHPPPAPVTASSTFCFFLFFIQRSAPTCISLRRQVHTLPSRVQLRGRLYLNNIHELRYTRQIYCSSTHGFREDPRRPIPYYCFENFLFSVYINEYRVISTGYTGCIRVAQIENSFFNTRGFLSNFLNNSVQVPKS